jgi:hypothetical protein
VKQLLGVLAAERADHTGSIPWEPLNDGQDNHMDRWPRAVA